MNDVAIETRSAKEILFSILPLIENGWVKNCYAKDIDGNVLSMSGIMEGKAVCYCMLGALVATKHNTDVLLFQIIEEIQIPLSLAVTALFGKSETQFNIAQWQDMPERTKGQVLLAIDLAIKYAIIFSE